MSKPRLTHILAQTRLHPTARPSQTVRTRLSILDAVASPFPPANGLWMYDSPSNELDKAALSTPQLLKSLQKTLDAYPHWAGQLQPAPYVWRGSATQRFGRLVLACATTSDPGIEVIFAECTQRMENLVPSPAKRASGLRSWDASEFPQEELISTTPVALHDGCTFYGLPTSSVQLTNFACGGVGISIRVVHALADATSLMNFVKGWAATNRAMVAKQPLPALNPVFEPSLLENITAGDLGANRPDPALLKISRNLPVHRYDRWAPSETCPDFFGPAMEATKPRSPRIRQEELSPANPIPWHECNFLAPSSTYHLYFSASEVQHFWKMAMATAQMPVSHLDALLAHLWARLSQARNLKSSEDIYLNMVLGVRPRLSTPLPDSFTGSPTIHVHASMQGNEVVTAKLGAVAESIRTTVAQFNDTTIPAVLHDLTFEAGAQRLWQFFLGHRHTTVTTWLRQGSSTLEFADNVSPRHVHFLLPNTMDGIVKIMEAPPVKNNRLTANERGKKRKHWSDDGVIVAMVMDREVMQRLLQDRLLRGSDEC